MSRPSRSFLLIDEDEEPFRFPFRNKARSPRVLRIVFSLMCPSDLLNTPILDENRALGCLAPSPRSASLLSASCSSDRAFAYSFLPTSGHPFAVAVRLRFLSPVGPFETCTKELTLLEFLHAHSRDNAPCRAHQGTARDKTRRPLAVTFCT